MGDGRLLRRPRLPRGLVRRRLRAVLLRRRRDLREDLRHHRHVRRRRLLLEGPPRPAGVRRHEGLHRHLQAVHLLHILHRR